MKYSYIVLICIISVSVITLSGCGNGATRSSDSTASTSPVVRPQANNPYIIGSVDTAFQWIGPDHTIEVGAVPDPKISGITCFYSRAKTGGIKGGLGIAENTSDASVACRQTGPIVFTQPIKINEEIRNERSSILFKKLRIVRFYDATSNSLIYMVYSDKLIDGSPKNSLSAVALGDISPILN